MKTGTVVDDQRLVFNNGSEIETILASISGKINKEEVEKILPYKDGYGTILLFKYNKGTPDIYPMMKFIRDDLVSFMPDAGNGDMRSFSKKQIKCLQECISLLKHGNLNDNNVCTALWNLIDKTFCFFAHERFTKQEVILFNMCYDMVEKKILETKAQKASVSSLVYV